MAGRKKKTTQRNRRKADIIFNENFLLLLRFFSVALITICILIIVLQGARKIETKIHAADSADSISKEIFITRLVPLAKENYTTYGILPSITLAQAILESNWGNSVLSLEYNNYFGIKSFKKTEQRVHLQTQEFYNEQLNDTQDYFRVYDSLKESVAHHGLLIGTAPRYKNVISAKDYKEASHELYKASYSTDPNYPDKLIQIIESYHLDQYDVK